MSLLALRTVMSDPDVPHIPLPPVTVIAGVGGVRWCATPGEVLYGRTEAAGPAECTIGHHQ